MGENTDNDKLMNDIEEFLRNLTGGDAEAAVIFMGVAEMLNSNPRLVKPIVDFQHKIRDDHAKMAGHSECAHEEYEKGMWTAINQALPFTSLVRDYIDFKVD